MSESAYIIKEVRTRQHPKLGLVKIWQHNPKFLFDEEKIKMDQAGPKGEYICADCEIDGQRLMTTWMIFRNHGVAAEEAADKFLMKALELTANESH